MCSGIVCWRPDLFSRPRDPRVLGVELGEVWGCYVVIINLMAIKVRDMFIPKVNSCDGPSSAISVM
jgi:hypothetical protein